LVDALGERIRDGRLSAGDKLPTEAEVMAEFGVSRTVVREAISKLQAAGMVETRHGIGTFVVGAGDASAFRIEPQQLATLRDVVAVLELRIGVESEAAASRRARPPTWRRCAPRWPPSPRRWRRGATRWRPTSRCTARSRAPRRTSTSPA
jgi:DNA-binding GntR family transcriptional regulator